MILTAVHAVTNTQTKYVFANPPSLSSSSSSTFHVLQSPPYPQYHDIALEADLKRLKKSCRWMLAHSPHVIDRGLRRGQVDAQQIRDILELQSLPMREPSLFRAFVAWLKLQNPEEKESLKDELKVGANAKHLLTAYLPTI